MGVKRLLSFIKKYPELSTRINFIEEIEKHRRQNGDAFIVFDFMGFIHVFGEDVEEVWLGGRLHIYLQRMKIFLEKLTKAGASLIFFCDGQLRPDRIKLWCDRRNREHELSLRIMRGDGNHKGQYIGCKSVVKSYLKLIEENNYGEIVISTKFDCDAMIAKYANERNALAIVASDSDFVIFDGSSQFWQTHEFDTERMCVRSYDRCKIRKFLRLSVDQMKILATIGGNDHSNDIFPANYRNYNNFRDIADFCRSLPTELNDKLYRTIANHMKDSRLVTEKDLRTVEQAISSYNINFELPEEPNAIIQMCTQNVLMYAFYTGGNFQYEVNFIDVTSGEKNNNNGQPFIDSLLEVFRKLGGILLCDRREMRLNIVTKYRDGSRYTLKIHAPIYPKRITEYEAFALGPHRIYHEIRWKLLFWSLGLDHLTKNELKNLPKTHIVTALALSFLSKAGEISEKQADALLTMHDDIVTKVVSLGYLKSLKYDCIAEDTIRTAQLFNRATTLIWDCLQVCALTEFISLDTFDGFYYAVLLNKFCSQQFYTDCLDRIQQYRHTYIECQNNNE